jgi:dihydropteroate synthase
MHDSLAHQLSVIAVHAGVLEYRTDLDPAATREAAATVGAAARDAATELRQVLGVLRAGEDGAQPLPDLQRLPELNALGAPVLVGSSRKSFLGSLLAAPDGTPRSVLDREDANVALTTIAAIQGVWGVRVHEVRASMDALKVVARWAAVPAGQPAVGVWAPDGRSGAAGGAGSVGPR